MAQGNLSACLPTTLALEGGLSMNRADPGNWTGGKVGVGELKGTNMGIAASAHPSLDIVHLTKTDVSAIYDREYWTPAGCEALPVGLDLCHFDATVNSGRGNSARWLKASGTAASVDAIHAYSAARLTSLHSFRTWASFGKGWAVRVAGVEAKAIVMATGPAAKTVIAKTGVGAADRAKGASIVAHGAAVIAGSGIAASPIHPTAGILVALVSAGVAIWSAFHASTSGARAAVLSHASAAL